MLHCTDIANQNSPLNRNLRHPNIVTMVAYAVVDASLYIVMEYVDGPNLDEVIFGTSHQVCSLQLAMLHAC